MRSAAAVRSRKAGAMRRVTPALSEGDKEDSRRRRGDQPE